MAYDANSTPTPAASTPIQQLVPRLAGVRAALDQLEPLLISICERPSPLYTGMEAVFHGLMDEAWAIRTVMLALPATNTEDLHIQAAIIRDDVADHLPNMPLLEQFLDRVEAYAA